MRSVLLVGKKTVFESGSPCLDAPISTRWQQHEQSMAWVPVVLDDFLCFPKASCVVDALLGWEMAADDALHCPQHPLEGLTISSGAAAEPGSNAARDDALNGAPVKVSEGFCRQAKLLESPQKALLGSFYSRVRLPGPGEVIFDEHTEELEAGDFLYFSSIAV